MEEELQNLIDAQISNFESFRISESQENRERVKLEKLRKQALEIKRNMATETTTEEPSEEITTIKSTSSTETDIEKSESVLEGSEGDDVLLETDEDSPNWYLVRGD